jgi:hypothetical protein
MPTITVKIKGASRAAKFFWNAKPKSLKSSGASFSAEFEAKSGSHVYVATLAGAPGEAWSVEVSGGAKTNKHAGHMSPGGIDATGDTPYKV